MAEKDKGPVIGLSWQPKLVDVLFVPPNDPIKLNKLLKSQRKDTLGKDWFDMPASTITPELKRDLQLLKLRSAIDPKRHYKRGDSKSKELPKYFQVGTVVESATDFYSGRLTKKERKVTIADELLYDQTFRSVEIEEKNRPGGNDKWKIKGEDASEDERGRRDEKEKISLSWQDEWSDSKNEAWLMNGCSWKLNYIPFGMEMNCRAK
ncbi:hypothetical protein D5086_018966 [Populus alba]|uniref:Uncharacterized protein n=1 Tax=Populus alba TaxID=43335 RepID=A0ACC4BHB3_POPAL